MSHATSSPQKATPYPFPYPPAPSAASPVNASPFGPPPAKKPRLSPDAASPQFGSTPRSATPPAYAAPAASAYGNPYAQSPSQQQQQQSPSHYAPSPYAASPPDSFNTPTAYHPPPRPAWQSQNSTSVPTSGPLRQPMSTNAQLQPQSQEQSPAQMMPPPPRPPSRAGVDEIGDSLYGVGINLKDEENYLMNAYNSRLGMSESSAIAQGASFESSTMSPNSSFNMLTQPTSFASLPGVDSALAGTVGRPRSQEEIEEEARAKRAKAARARNESRSHHLNHPFLLARCLFNRLETRAKENGVRLSSAGLCKTAPEDSGGRTQVMTNADRTEGLVRVRYKLEENTELEQIVTLLSLATGERLRGLVDEAWMLARARKYGDHGRVVPPEFADVAVGDGMNGTDEIVVAENITGSAWDRVSDAAERDADKVEGDTLPTKPQRTLSFSSRISETIRAIAERDRRAEQERTAKREARRRKAAESAAATAPDDPDNPADATMADATNPSVAAEGVVPAKATKKEVERQRKEAARSVEMASQATTNQTAAFALGKKGSKYSWMTGGVSAVPVNRYKAAGTPSSGTATPTAGAAQAAGVATVMAKTGTPNKQGGVAAGEAEVKGDLWGAWREEGERGIGVRDWAAVLERDGKEKVAIQRLWNRV